MRWKVDRPEVTRGYATPAVYRPKNGPPELIVPGAPTRDLPAVVPTHLYGLPCDMETATNEGRTAFGEDMDHPALRGLRQKDFFTWGADEIVYRNAYVKPTRGETLFLSSGRVPG